MEKAKEAIGSILKRKEYLLDTPRNITTRRAARELLDVAASKEDLFSKFSSELIGKIEKVFPAKRLKRNPREKILARFQAIRLDDLDKVWDSLCERIGREVLTVDRMLRQYTNEKLFNDLFISYFSQTKCPATVSSTTLTEYERDIVRYIAGYVPFKLFRKYEKKDSIKASMYVECLSHMKVRGSEESLANYATAWIEEVNRGGLFEVNNATYSLFCTLEELVREGESMPLILSKEDLLKKVETSEAIEYQWSLLSIDIDDEDWANDLLDEICSLWLSVRCHALTRKWMETYKQSKLKTVKKSKSLRKGLKKNELQTTHLQTEVVSQEERGKQTTATEVLEMEEDEEFGQLND